MRWRGVLNVTRACHQTKGSAGLRQLIKDRVNTFFSRFTPVRPVPPAELRNHLCDSPVDVTGLQVYLRFFDNETDNLIHDELSPYVAIERRRWGGEHPWNGKNFHTLLLRDEGLDRLDFSTRRIFGLKECPTTRGLLRQAHNVGLLPAYPEAVIVHDFGDPERGLTPDIQSIGKGWLAYFLLHAGNVFEFRHRSMVDAFERPATFKLLAPRGSVIVLSDNALMEWDHGTVFGRSLEFRDRQFRREDGMMLQVTSSLDYGMPSRIFQGFK